MRNIDTQLCQVITLVQKARISREEGAGEEEGEVM